MSDPMQPNQPFAIGTGGEGPAPGLGENERLMAAASYWSQFIIPAVLPLILLFTEQGKQSPFVRWHSVHSLALLAVTVAYEIVATVIFTILSAIFPPLACILWLIFLVPIAGFIYYGIPAYQGKSPAIPYVTEFLRKQNWV